MHLRLLATLLILLLNAAPGQAGAIKLTIAPLAAKDSPKALVSEYLKKLMEERSSGRIQVSIIDEEGDADFGKIRDALASQRIQMALPEIRELRNHLPLLSIYGLPFLFRDRQHLHRAIDSEIGGRILQGAQQHKLKPLAVWDGASRQLLAAEALTSPGDILPALFSAAQSGRPGTDQSWREVTLPEAERQAAAHSLTALTLTSHSLSVCTLLTHQDFWDRLPEDLKVIIHGAVADATLYFRELTDQADQKALERLKENAAVSIHTLSAQQRARWQKKLLPLYAQSLERAELQIVDTITKD